jgi:hypothetical protein
VASAGLKVADFSVDCRGLVRMAGKGLSEGKLTAPTGPESSIDSLESKNTPKELNAEALSTQREEKPREGESDWLDGEVSMGHGSTALFYCQGLLFNEYHSN